MPLAFRTWFYLYFSLFFKLVFELEPSKYVNISIELDLTYANLLHESMERALGYHLKCMQVIELSFSVGHWSTEGLETIEYG